MKAWHVATVTTKSTIKKQQTSSKIELLYPFVADYIHFL